MSELERPPAASNTREQFLTDVDRQTSRITFAPGDALPNLEMWVLVRKLGGGGFGEVWLARHERKGEAAVKFCTDPVARHKLVTHEKTVVARVMKYGGNHPNIVPLLECNLSGDIPWLMYEFVAGGTLAEAAAEWRKLSPPRRLGRAVRTLHAMTGALGTFHRLNPPIVHRDLKPQNVLMAGSTPRITDFGIGGAAGLGEAIDLGTGLMVQVPTFLQTAGSSRYAPPEQFLGAPPSPRDDVFALGILAYQLILGDLEADPGPDVARGLRALRIPSELASLIVESMAFDPERRPRDATEWETRLAALLRKKTSPEHKTPPKAAKLIEEDTTDGVAEPLAALGESDLAGAVSQTLTVAARGRWYSRRADQPDADWRLITTTPADVRISGGEIYRFSIYSAATEKDVDALGSLGGLASLTYLNLSFCAGVTDAGLGNLKGFTGLRQLYLRGCPGITDASLPHLHGLSALRTLELIDCPQLTGAALSALRGALPRCKILH